MSKLPMMIVLALLATTFSGVKSNLTCNSQSYGEDDPYGDSVAYVLAELMNATPSKDHYDYNNTSPYPTSVAYGHGNCILSLNKSECAICLGQARSILIDTCSGYVGGQVEIVGCFMRYENYEFS